MAMKQSLGLLLVAAASVAWTGSVLDDRASLVIPKAKEPARGVRPAAESTLQRIERSGERVGAGRRAAADVRIAAVEMAVDRNAAARGAGLVAARLAGEFDTTPAVILDEKRNLGVSLGELAVAYALFAKTKAGVTVPQLVEMRGDGAGWGQIAAGLGIGLGSAVKAVRTDGRTVMGQAGTSYNAIKARAELSQGSKYSHTEARPEPTAGQEGTGGEGPRGAERAGDF